MKLKNNSFDIESNLLKSIYKLGLKNRKFAHWVFGTNAAIRKTLLEKEKKIRLHFHVALRINLR